MKNNLILWIKPEYKNESKASQYFGSLFSLFSKIQQKKPRIQSRGHRVAPSGDFPWSHADTSSCFSQKFPSPFSCWIVTQEVIHELEQMIIRVGSVRIIGWGGISLIPASFWSLFQVIRMVWGFTLSCCGRIRFLYNNTGYFCRIMA